MEVAWRRAPALPVEPAAACSRPGATALRPVRVHAAPSRNDPRPV